MRANESIDMIELREGTKLANPPQQPLRIEINCDEPPANPRMTDFFESPYFVVSSAMRRALDKKLFRLDEHRALVVISERIKHRLEAAGLAGIYYQKTGKFNGDPASSFWED